MEGESLFQPSKSSAFGLSSIYNSGDLTNQGADDTIDRVTIYNVSFAEMYVKGKIKVVLKLRCKRCGGEDDLVFRAIQDRDGMADDATLRDGKIPLFPEASSGTGVDAPMFACVTQFVQCKQKVIPSLVWLERTKQREDFRRQVLARSRVHLHHVRFGVSKGEVSFLSADSSRCDGTEVACLIEGRPQVFKCHGYCPGNIERDGVHYADFKVFMNSVQIILDDVFVGFRLEEFNRLPFDVGETCLCLQNAPSRTVEDDGIHRDNAFNIP